MLICQREHILSIHDSMDLKKYIKDTIFEDFENKKT